MKSKRLFLPEIVVMGLAAFAYAGLAQAVCNQSSPEADFVLNKDATKSCANLTGHFGCNINRGDGTCTAIDPDDSNRYFKVISTNNNNEISWHVDEDNSTIPIDYVGTNGGKNGGSGCSYGYDPDVWASTSLGDSANNGTFANVTSVDFCSDGDTETAPAVAKANTMVASCTTYDEQGFVLPTTDIFGAVISCENVPPWQELTVVVAREFMDDLETLDPNFGFTVNENGVPTDQITLRNICVCNGPTPSDPVPQCDPDGNVINGPEIDRLAVCNSESGDREPTGVLFQGSGSAFSGGSRRWY